MFQKLLSLITTAAALPTLKIAFAAGLVIGFILGAVIL